MSIANVIKSRLARKKKRKIFEDYASGKKTENKRADLPISMGGTRTDGTTAESWDWKRQNPRIDEPYKEQYRKEMESKQGAKGKSPESKPAKKIKPMEQEESVEWKPMAKEEKRKKRKKAEKPKSEFLEKYYGKDWA